MVLGDWKGREVLNWYRENLGGLDREAELSKRI